MVIFAKDAPRERRVWPARRSYPVQSAIAVRVYYGWIVVAVTVLASLLIFGIRSAPGVLIKPLERDLGWSRSEISFAISVGLLCTAVAAPLGGALMDRFGPRRVLLACLVLIGGSVGASAAMQQLWQMVALWGVLTGIGTGMAAILGATVANRWFVARRGLAQGILGAGTSAGQLVFLPILSWLVVTLGWREASVIAAVVLAGLIVPVLLLMRDLPSDIGLQPYGVAPGLATPATRPGSPLATLQRAIRVPEFWLLAGSFFVCGATSVGIVGTHFIPHAVDHGYAEVTAASVLAAMGAMNFAGTLVSGLLTDRVDPRKLLACYYTFRGVSLFLLPFITDLGIGGLTAFAIVFGLDYIATVPPTIALCADLFGRRNVGTIYGWVFCAHQIGAALMAYIGGAAQDALGTYTLAFIGSGMLAVLGGVMALRIERRLLPEEPLVSARAAA
jgi:MFS family permease